MKNSAKAQPPNNLVSSQQMAPKGRKKNDTKSPQLTDNSITITKIRGGTLKQTMSNKKYSLPSFSILLLVIK